MAAASTKEQGRKQDISATDRLSVGATIRLLMALGVTLLLPSVWVMTLAVRMRLPLKTPIWAFLVLAPTIALLVTMLTRGLLDAPRRRIVMGLLSLAAYLGAITSVLWYYTGSNLPFWQVWIVLATASLWVYWLVWGYPSTRSWPVVVGGLIVTGLWGWFYPQVIRFDGLTGNAKVNFAWVRRTARRPELATTQSTPATGESVTGGAGPQRSSADAQGLVGADRPGTETLDTLGPADRMAGPADFPEFLGNRRATLSPRPLNTDWKSNAPQQVWRRPVGAGWSSFAIVGDRAITQEQRGEQECVVCYRLSTGEELWVHAVPTKFTSVLGGDGPRATPTIDDGRVYTVGGTGHLASLDLATGRPYWEKDLLADNQGQPISHGVCGSPLIVGGQVIASVTGRPGISLVSYDKLTGERRWQAGKWDASYSSPQLATLLGEPQLLIYNGQGVEGHSVESGELLWDFAWSNGEHTVGSQPVVIPGRNDRVLLSVGYGQGAVMIQLSRAADGAWRAVEQWTSKDLKTKFTTAVFHQGHLYGLDNGILACIDAESGERRWKKGRYEHGQILLVGDWLLVQAESGELVLVRPAPDGLHEEGRLPALSSKTWNNPALGGELLLLRNDQEAVCYRIGPAAAAVARASESGAGGR
ncbi:MAG: PQQ-binding-like beta-propeller repeat protein [Pirellulales bacterium]